MTNSSVNLHAISIGVVVTVVMMIVVNLVMIPIDLNLIEAYIRPKEHQLVLRLVAVGGALLSFLIFFLGGYVAARMAGSRAIVHSVIVAAISAAAIGSAAVFDDQTDQFFLAGITAVSIVGGVFGGYVARRAAHPGSTT